MVIPVCEVSVALRQPREFMGGLFMSTDGLRISDPSLVRRVHVVDHHRWTAQPPPPVASNWPNTDVVAVRIWSASSGEYLIRNEVEAILGG